MPSSDRDELLEQIAALRRETRTAKRWAVFTGICAAIFLFAPGLAAFIAAWFSPLFALLEGSSAVIVPILAVVVLVCGGAFVASHFIPRGPEPVVRESDEA